MRAVSQKGLLARIRDHVIMADETLYGKGLQTQTQGTSGVALMTGALETCKN